MSPPQKPDRCLIRSFEEADAPPRSQAPPPASPVSIWGTPVREGPDERPARGLSSSDGDRPSKEPIDDLLSELLKKQSELDELSRLVRERMRTTDAPAETQPVPAAPVIAPVAASPPPFFLLDAPSRSLKPSQAVDAVADLASNVTNAPDEACETSAYCTVSPFQFSEQRSLSLDPELCQPSSATELDGQPCNAAEIADKGRPKLSPLDRVVGPRRPDAGGAPGSRTAFAGLEQPSFPDQAPATPEQKLHAGLEQLLRDGPSF